MTKHGPAILILLCVALSAGCSSTPDVKIAEELANLPYPKAAPVGGDLDIVVTQHWNNVVHLHNRTASSYSNVQVWLNQQYVMNVPVIGLSSGGDNSLDLEGFINRYRQPYPTGGILSPDKAYPVVLAELFNPATGQRHRLLVRRNSNL